MPSAAMTLGGAVRLGGMSPAGLSLLTLNIGNPSVARARRQLAWLIRRDEQVLVLTETKASAGCRLLAGEFSAAGYAVHYPEPGPGEYGTMIVATVPVTPDDGFGHRVGFLQARAAAAILPAPGGPLRVIGLYVPARDASIGKTERKRKWLAACDAALASPAGEMPPIVLGDLNVLEPGHRPGYPFFEPFEYDFYLSLAGPRRLTDAFRHLHPDEAEYSWVGRAGDGYRYDHAFCCQSLSGHLVACDYLHQPRFDRLSDHSALTMTLAITPPAPLPPLLPPPHPGHRGEADRLLQHQHPVICDAAGPPRSPTLHQFWPLETGKPGVKWTRSDGRMKSRYEVPRHQARKARSAQVAKEVQPTVG